MSECAVPYPKKPTLHCLKPSGHNGAHATCLGYHPPPYDEYEWAWWPNVTILKEER